MTTSENERARDDVIGFVLFVGGIALLSWGFSKRFKERGNTT